MKKFTTKAFIFSAIFMCIMFVMVMTGPILFNNNPSFYKTKKGKHILATGDSHMQCSFDNSLIPGSLNLSLSADSYFYTYLKIRKLIEHNENLDTIILSFGYHNLNKSNETRWYKEKSFIQTKLPKYFSLMTGKEYFDLLKHNPSAVFSATFDVPKKTAIPVFKTLNGNASFVNLGLGKFKGLKTNDIEKHIENYTKSGQDTVTFKNSEIEETYLLKIRDLCKSNNKTLILLNTPIHPYIYEKLKEDREYYYSFYNKNLSDFKLLDYANLQYPDSLYGDLTHLNLKGATEFTVLLKEQIKK